MEAQLDLEELAALEGLVEAVGVVVLSLAVARPGQED